MECDVNEWSARDGAWIKAPSTEDRHIEMTETLVRLYVFLAQDVERCLHEAEQSTYPEHDLHLSSTREKMIRMLSVNSVVQGKVAQECTRMLTLITACRAEGSGKAAAKDILRAERAILKNKTMALSDVLAVFRSVQASSSGPHFSPEAKEETS
jgi:hypothetical protein